ncbi:MAG TPA: DUF6263 family protein [Chitinophagaceae bacterium]
MKHILVVLFIAVNYISPAQSNSQSNYSVTTFKKGDQFLKQIFTNSNYFLQLGDDSLDIKTRSLVIKSYTVDDISDEGYSFTVTTEKIADTVNSMGKEISYNSEMLADSNSLIEKAIKNMIGTPVKIQVDINGVIISVTDDDSTSYSTDSLISLAGLEPERFTKGSRIALIAGFPTDMQYKNGHSWTDSALINDQKTVTTYGIDSNGNAKTTTTILFTSKVSEKYVNTNINGKLLIDNETGLVLEKLTQSATLGYQFLNGLVYLLDKRTAVSESCYKKTD